jgi:hypothetical protein
MNFGMGLTMIRFREYLVGPALWHLGRHFYFYILRQNAAGCLREKNDFGILALSSCSGPKCHKKRGGKNQYEVFNFISLRDSGS